METKANHVLIGAFTVAVATAMLLFALWAARYAAESSWRDYDVIFHEAISGLSVGGIVQYNGITVGSVRDLSLAPDDPRQVIARVRLEADTPVKQDTTAKLAFTGLTGVAFIQLSGGSPASPPLETQPGREVPAIIAEESAFQKLMSSSEDIATAASEVLVRIRNILSNENAERVAKTLANIDAVTTAIADERQDIGTMIRSLRAASERLERGLAGTEQSIARLDRFTAALDEGLTGDIPALASDLKQSIANLESLTRSADEVLSANQDALSNFGDQGLAQVGPALAELRALLRELNRISTRLEDNPAAFILGRDQPQEFEPK